MNQYPDIRVVAFDADDTLWDCQSFFDQVEREYCRLLAPFAPAETVSAELFRVEKANMPALGFGSKAFTLSLIENALNISGGEVSGHCLRQILMLGKSLPLLPATPLPHVTDTLQELRTRGHFKMVLFTKGELLEQQHKLQRSGLAEWFDDVVIVTDKTVDEYRNLCRRHAIAPQQLLMIGNSFKSDVEPALLIGAYAIHIPFHVMWRLEHAPTYDHPHLLTLSQFSDLPAHLL